MRRVIPLVPGVAAVSDKGLLFVDQTELHRAGARLSRMGPNQFHLFELDDGWEIEGPSRLQGAKVSSRGDHRVAMALAVAGLLAAGETVIEGAESASISYPEFWDQLDALCH